jgi:hypothetical protein
VLHAEGPRASQREAGSGMNGGVLVSHRSTQAPQGIRNLGEALIAICTLSSFPPSQGTPTYAALEARIKELTAYVQRHTDTAYSRLRPLGLCLKCRLPQAGLKKGVIVCLGDILCQAPAYTSTHDSSSPLLAKQPRRSTRNGQPSMWLDPRESWPYR